MDRAPAEIVCAGKTPTVPYSLSGFDRAESEVIGTLLMTALIITASVTIGTSLVVRLDQQADAEQSPVDIDASLESTTASVTHTGGDSFDRADVVFVLRQGAQERRFNLSNESAFKNDILNTNDRFQPGESVTVSHSFTGEVRLLLLVTTSQSRVLYDRYKTVPTTTATATPTPTPTATSTSTSTPTPTATPTPTPTPTPTEPAVQSSSVNDRSTSKKRGSGGKAEYTVSYNISDPDNRFQRVEITFAGEKGSETIENTSLDGSVSFTGKGQTYGDEYTITIEVINTQGQVTDTVQYTDTADGTNP